MLSNDLKGAAASLRGQIVAVNEGGRISIAFCKSLAANLDACAEQAVQIERQTASGSPVMDNVKHLRPDYVGRGVARSRK